MATEVLSVLCAFVALALPLLLAGYLVFRRERRTRRRGPRGPRGH